MVLPDEVAITDLLAPFFPWGQLCGLAPQILAEILCLDLF